MSINERIKYLRTELLKDTAGKKMSLEDFGARLSIGKTAVSKIEKGENNVTDRIVRTICREFSVREEWLRDGEGEPFLKMDDEEIIMECIGRIMSEDSDRRRVIAFLSQMSPENFEVLMNTIKGVAAAIKKED